MDEVPQQDTRSFLEKVATRILDGLRESHCYSGVRNNTDNNTIMIGDIVLVHCKDQPRHYGD